MRSLTRLLTTATVALGLALPAAGAQAAQTREFQIVPNGAPAGLTTGPDGNLWVAINLGRSIARVTPAGAVTTFDVGFVTNNKPDQITTGPDGALWFTDNFLLGDPSKPSAGVIHRATTAGAITDFPLPTVGLTNGITRGPDNALWYTMQTNNLVGRITTDGVVSEFPLPGPDHRPNRIAAGADGALWFVEEATHSIGRLTTAGAYSEFPLPTPNSAPRGITAGPDGAIWFTEFNTSRVGRITPDGKITEFPLPGTDANPGAIITGPDGALYVADGYHGHVDRLTVLGQWTSYETPSVSLNDLAVGPDENIWYTRGTNTLGRLDTLAPPVVGKTVDAEPVSGVVKVKTPTGKGFVPLGKDGAVIPIGSEVDATGGRVRITAASGTGSPVTKTSEFYDGRFFLGQTPGKDAILDLRMSGPLGCGASLRSVSRKKKGRSLWGDGKGTFRTTGKRSAATVRGTNWLVEDRCDGSTLTRVNRGVVSVFDNVKRKTFTVKAGGTYVARPKQR